MKQPKKPLLCYGCGVNLFNDHSSQWIGHTVEERNPYCYACAPHWEIYDPYVGYPHWNTYGKEGRGPQ